MQRWNGNYYNPEGALNQKEEVAYLPHVARLSADRKSVAELVRGQILDENRKPFLVNPFQVNFLIYCRLGRKAR
ncbi:hypothetical protein EXU85_08935 [Spirosoma sp. KCTC 42546]|uniref:hypothetical protein n=1 Tax=Spirosoma sp. KCTC 42546 TaxID=2520506 RepID=UPI00115B6C61|nr:hypothetical protein [Spirosoma sp. KCTC 42546]QDK78724.1 hypothetical protein EXU85_08935 [Spirosoma sp. KCTC 42546]